MRQKLNQSRNSREKMDVLTKWLGVDAVAEGEKETRLLSNDTKSLLLCK